jgi:hypothetical protein
VQTEGEKIRWHLPQVPHVGLVHHVEHGWVELDRKSVRAKELVLDRLQDIPADAFASVAAFDLQVANPTDWRSRSRHQGFEFATPVLPAASGKLSRQSARATGSEMRRERADQRDGDHRSGMSGQHMPRR